MIPGDIPPPRNQAKVLNVPPWFAAGIEGMENAGDALLEQAVSYAIQPENYALGGREVKKQALPA